MCFERKEHTKTVEVYMYLSAQDTYAAIIVDDNDPLMWFGNSPK